VQVKPPLPTQRVVDIGRVQGVVMHDSSSTNESRVTGGGTTAQMQQLDPVGWTLMRCDMCVLPALRQDHNDEAAGGRDRAHRGGG
jgi:hypothetical protein